MKKGRILHLEDDPQWVENVQKLLGSSHDLYAAASPKEAASLFMEMANENLKFDLAIIDISLILHDAHDKKGFEFIEALEESGVMEGHKIIVLTGYPEVDQNWRKAFRDFDVVDVFDKGTLIDNKAEFIKEVSEAIKN